ncbi:hypothetical protein MYFR107205_15720 [Mycolicibacterium frederiksbergense]
MPLVGPSTRVAVKESPSASVSLPNTLPVRTLSSSVAKESSTATGMSLTGLTVIDTVAIELVSVPSPAV